jgi:altronate hydrolase
MATERKGRAVMRLSPQDNVAVALRALKAGETVLLDDVPLTVELTVAVGAKLAARAIADGEIVVKYHCPIGIAKRGIAPGERIDKRNVETNYLPVSALLR